MNKCVTYYENGVKFTTHNMKIRNVVKILVKKDGVPFKTITFHKTTGRIIAPNELESVN